jgi:hypothetical protein
MALRQGRQTGYSIGKIERIFKINRKTICRWIAYFREQFPQTAKWKRLRGRVCVQVKDSELPSSLLQFFIGQSGSEENGLIGCLHFLAAGI